MNNQNSKKKKLINISVLTFAVIAVVCAFLFGGIDKNVSADDGIIVYDSDGGKLASLKLEDNEIKTVLIDEDAAEYVFATVEEALEIYSVISGKEDVRSEFFSTVKKIKTNMKADVLEKIKKGYELSEISDEAAFASVITDTQGKVLAMYGSGSDSNVVYSIAKAYAGSAIKPLSVYAPAIQSGKAHWSSMIIDSPVKKVVNSNGQTVDWPSNANGSYTNEGMLLCDAVYESINTVAVKILRNLPVEKSIYLLENNLGLDVSYEKELAEDMGGDEVLGNIALGYLHNGVSPYEMTGYYQIFANGGYYTEPYTVSCLEGSDGVIYTAETERKRVISEETASVMTQLLRGVVYPGATAEAAYLDKVEVAGKSGTSDGYEDNWFVGYTNEYVCSVWHGKDKERKNKASATFALIMENMPVEAERFRISGDVKLKFYCRKTGLLKGEGCKDAASGYYCGGNVPAICTRCR